MTKWVLVVVLAFVTFPSNGIAQSENPLVGTWKLVSAKDTTDKGEVKDAFGPNPTGFLTYTADGRMMGIITNGGRKPLSINDSRSAPAEERAEAFSTMIAYAGRYTYTGDKVIHHVEISYMQNNVNTDQVRYIVKLEGNRLILRTPSKLELVWERLTSETDGR